LLFGLRRSSVLLLLVYVSPLLMVGCGANPLSLLTGGGPNIAANVQAGAENNQGINIKTEAPSVTLRPKSRVDTIDQSTTKNTNIDPWIILLLVLGWLLPSPNEMVRWIRELFKRKK